MWDELGEAWSMTGENASLAAAAGEMCAAQSRRLVCVRVRGSLAVKRR